jgi:hypothetical protein
MIEQLGHLAPRKASEEARRKTSSREKRGVRAFMDISLMWYVRDCYEIPSVGVRSRRLWNGKYEISSEIIADISLLRERNISRTPYLPGSSETAGSARTLCLGTVHSAAPVQLLVQLLVPCRDSCRDLSQCGPSELKPKRSPSLALKFGIDAKGNPSLNYQRPVSAW